MIDRLSPRALRVYETCCRRIASGAFNSMDVERFLIYGRYVFSGDGWLREFANAVAHSVRNQGKTFSVVTAIRNLSAENLLNPRKKHPVGEVGVRMDALSRELAQALMAADCDPVEMSVVEDLCLCLVLIGGQMVFSEGCDNQQADVVVTKSQISLIVGSEDYLYINLLCVPNRYFALDEGNEILLGDCLVEAERNEGDRLELKFRSAPEYAPEDLKIKIEDK